MCQYSGGIQALRLGAVFAHQILLHILHLVRERQVCERLLQLTEVTFVFPVLLHPEEAQPVSGVSPMMQRFLAQGDTLLSHLKIRCLYQGMAHSGQWLHARGVGGPMLCSTRRGPVGGRMLCSTHQVLVSPQICFLPHQVIINSEAALTVKGWHRLQRSFHPLILIHAVSPTLRELGRRLNRQRWRRGLHTQTDTTLWHDSRRCLVPILLFERDRSVPRLTYLRCSCRDLSALGGWRIHRRGVEW